MSCGLYGRVRGLAFAASVMSACRAEAPVPLHTADTSSGVASTAPGEETTPPPQEPSRDLWFASGPGRDAILARERRDFATAKVLLDAMLADGTLGVDDRGAAMWLRGLEDLRERKFASAARRFGEARRAPALQPLSIRLLGLEAQALLDAGRPEQALNLVQGLDRDVVDQAPRRGDLIMIGADARLRTRDPDGAQAEYQRYLSVLPKGARRYEARIKLARILAESSEAADAMRAVELYESLVLESPLSDYGEEARKALRRHPGRRKGAKARAFESEVSLARVEASLRRRHYKQTISMVDRLLKSRRVDAETRCRLLFAKGSAIFKQRKRAKARPTFDAAAASCKKAGRSARTFEVKSRYQGARGRYAEGKYALAAAAFESLAKEHADHSYADDAWILAGESWADKPDAHKAKAAYRAGLAVGGDMRDEAGRRLLVAAFADKDPKEALKIIDGAVDSSQGPARAKLLYFRGRALAALGRGEDARDAWLDVLTSEPLGYASLQALGRLRELGDDALAAGRAVLESSAETPPEVQTPDAQRALLLARLGLGEEASEELRKAGVDGWPAVAVLNQAGLFSEGQRLLANMGHSWKQLPVERGPRSRWELAFPRPFSGIVDPGEATHAVPPLLTYAIMRTESRFDPSVTSWAGARGLLQLMPKTAAGLAADAGVELGDRGLFDPAVNLDLGMRYLGRLAARFGGHDGAVALAVPSYNAGAGAVVRWLDERGRWDLDLYIESIPYDETRKYTQGVLGRWFAYRWLYATDPEQRVPYLPLQIPGRAASSG